MCLCLIKTQEEQTTSSKGSRQKPKEKADQARDTQKDKRRMAINRKGLSAGTAGAIAPLSDMDQNNFAGQFSQEKFIRWASESPREGNARAPNRRRACPASGASRWPGLLPGSSPVCSQRPKGRLLSLKGLWSFAG